MIQSAQTTKNAFNYGTQTFTIFSRIGRSNKIELKDSYLSVILHKDSRELVGFLWGGNLCELMCFCFLFGASSKNLQNYKIIKSSSFSFNKSYDMNHNLSSQYFDIIYLLILETI